MRNDSTARCLPWGTLGRRQMLKSVSAGFGYLALAGLAGEAKSAETGPLAPKTPHMAPRAKRVIFLYMRGGPSQMETFDYKPRLNADNGKPARRENMKYFGSQWKFAQHGESGQWVSELLPNTARHMDKLCVIRSMQTDHLNHPEASDQWHTGSFQFERPSIGSWTVYGLGTENQNLPGFISLKPPVQWGGARYYGSAFLPAAYQGTAIGTMNEPITRAKLTHLSHPSQTLGEQRKQLDFLQSLNREMVRAAGAESEALEGVIASYELGFRMQQDLPSLMDLQQETQETLDLYGVGQSPTDDFGRQCLMARRFAEAGVRFIELTHDNWDHHGGVAKLMPMRCQQTDQPIAALLVDLERRGMLEDTLVVWGGEFGRTPDDPRGDGRGHNKDGFTVWLAGGGARGGLAYGQTDEHGYEAVEQPVHLHDLHATILHLLGLDHERLTFRYGGRDFRLTDVHGKVVEGLCG